MDAVVITPSPCAQGRRYLTWMYPQARPPQAWSEHKSPLRPGEREPLRPATSADPGARLARQRPTLRRSAAETPRHPLKPQVETTPGPPGLPVEF